MALRCVKTRHHQEPPAGAPVPVLLLVIVTDVICHFERTSEFTAYGLVTEHL